MNTFNLRRLAFIAALGFALASCGNLFQTGAQKNASLAVRLAGGSATKGRTILPAAITDLSLLKYDLALTRAGQADITLTGVEYDALTISEILAGGWTLSVTGKRKADGLAVFGKSAAVTIASGPNSISWSLDPLQVGTGGFNVAVSWPQGTAIAAASAYLSNDLADFHKGGALSSGITSDFSGSSPNLVINETGIASGTYYLSVELEDAGGKVVALARELVRIFDNQVSVYQLNASVSPIVIAAGEISKPPLAPSGIVLSPFAAGVERISWTDNSNTETGFRIYRDGTALSPDITTPGTLFDDVDGTYSHTYTVVAFNDFGESSGVSAVSPGIAAVTIDFSVTNPSLEIFTFSPSSVSVAVGQQLSLSTSNPVFSPLTGWVWTKDDSPLVGQVSAIAVWTPALGDMGSHKINASVVYNGIKYSGDLTVTVINPQTASYSVVYNDNGATGGVAPDAAFYAAGASFHPADNAGALVKTGFFFAGWTDDAAGLGTIYSSVAPSYTMGGADVEFYAKWLTNGSVLLNYTLVNPAGYPTISFSSPKVTIAQDASVSLSTSSSLAAYPGWKWYIDGAIVSGEVGATFVWASPTKALGEHIIGASVVYDGVEYSGELIVSVQDPANPPTTYSATYSSQGADYGDVPIDGTAYTSGSIVVKANTGGLTRARHSLQGWTDNPAGSGTLYLPGDTYPAGNVTFYPMWVPNLLVNAGWEIDEAGWDMADGGSGWVRGPGLSAGSIAIYSSYEWCTHSQTIDLAAQGFSQAQLENAGTIFTFNEWLAGDYMVNGFAYFTMELLDADGNVLATVSDGDSGTPLSVAALQAWAQHPLSYTNAGMKPIRKVRVLGAGKDYPGWYGDYGPVFTEPSLLVDIGSI